jgi:hypothetical protein
MRCGSPRSRQRVGLWRDAVLPNDGSAGQQRTVPALVPDRQAGVMGWTPPDGIYVPR